MAARSLWRTRTKLLVVSTALCGGSGAAFIASSDDPSTSLKLCTAIPLRLFRNTVTVTAASIAFDYEYSLMGLAEGSTEMAKVKHQVHLRSAQKIQELCFKDAGIYIKLGQHIGQLVSQTFAEMMFKHEFVHCDPHAANMIVRPDPSGKRNIYGKRKPQLVLLDHGLYKELDFNTRFNYASLWKALIFSDANAIKEHSAKLGAGDDLYILFAMILTMRP